MNRFNSTDTFFVIFSCVLFVLLILILGCHAHLHIGEKHFHDGQSQTTEPGPVVEFPE